MRLDAYAYSKGWRSKDHGKPYSTMGHLRTTYTKGSSSFVFGLGELGHPPTLLWPEPIGLAIKAGILKPENGMIRMGLFARQIERTIAHYGNDRILEWLES